MPIRCRVCGGEHLTQNCLSARETAEVPQQAVRRPAGRPARQTDWIIPEHEQMLDILEQHHGALRNPERTFVLEGVTRGCYGEARDARTPFSPDAQVVVGAGYQIHIDGQLVHHGSLWTTKSLGDRHRQHLTNCVKDSQAWSEKKVDLSVEDVVDRLVQQFGEYEQSLVDGKSMYYRLHEKPGRRSVKVFVDPHGQSVCDTCQHCAAYSYLNELLGCNAAHGPKAGWASDEQRRRQSRAR
eukprot:gb/GFBE01000977.1/.p1 GENE.gb/GFBE01000977.1/~~gb/GFBE01000977.1/.p1  ORF type:complete len:240 (+),score=23.01 gb/GFBE01000977.1/:1-720(+)